MKTIPIQHDLCPALPNIYDNIDYKTFRNTLIKINEILTVTGFEENLVTEMIHNQTSTSTKSKQYWYKHYRYALRCNIARHLTGESLRNFSMRLVDSDLIKWFTDISGFSYKKGVSKNSIGQYEKMFNVEMVMKHIHQYQSRLTDQDISSEIGLDAPIDFSCVYADTTCIKANIHFPVDWVLLRDAARSLLLAITCIRKHGLKHRMPEPKTLLRKMNKSCIAMSNTRRKKDSKKKRKAILRDMKKLSQCIRKHAQRYRMLLEKEWHTTDLSLPETEQIIARIDNILKQLPAAIKQAHERIIGERRVDAKEKILSLYDHHAQIIVRGKSGNEVEFGQGLLLVEQADGIIVDWDLFAEQPPSDNKLLAGCTKRLMEHYRSINSIAADRKFDSIDNQGFLTANNIYNGLCPRNPHMLTQRLQEPRFLKLQTRRAQTEGRIGIFKNVFLGRPLRTKVFTYKRTAIAWSVLAHNLWVIARKALSDEKAQRLKKAA